MYYIPVYHIPVSIQGVHITLCWIQVCNQISIRQSLIQGEALRRAWRVTVRYVHRYIHEYWCPAPGTKA